MRLRSCGPQGQLRSGEQPQLSLRVAIREGPGQIQEGTHMCACQNQYGTGMAELRG